MRLPVSTNTSLRHRVIIIFCALVGINTCHLAQAQPPGPLQAPAIIRMAADQPEQHQLFKGPTAIKKEWRLCVVLPNVSDKFWDDIISGVREESARLGITSVIYEASGYTDAGLVQQERILNQRCSAGKLDAVLLAAVKSTGLNDSLRRLREQQVLVVDFVNGYDTREVDARAFLDNYHLGNNTGLEVKKYLAAPPSPQKPRLLWVPGPRESEWVARADEGFRAALAEVDIEIETLYLNPHYREQARDLRKQLQAGKNYTVIVGTGPTSVAAYQLKEEGLLPKQTPLFAYYATPDVEKLIATGDVLASVSNEPKMIGRMGVALAIGKLEKLPMPFQVGPEPVLLHSQQGQ